MIYKNCHYQKDGSSVVYWIHKPEHTDMWTQGYIGITNQPVKERWRAHKLAASNGVENKCDVLNRAIRKHDDLIYEVILVADTREYCEKIEGLLRPKRRIGWNLAIGGMSVDTYFGGIANKYRWIQYWKDKPLIASQRWWDAEMVMLKKMYKDGKTPLIAHDPKRRRISIRNESGMTGVTWYKPYKCWRSQVCISNKILLIGYYNDINKAKHARTVANEIVFKYKDKAIDFNNAVLQIKRINNLESKNF